MKSIVYTHYWSPEVLQFQEVEKPAPRDHEVLINVQAASVNALDRHNLRGPFLARIDYTQADVTRQGQRYDLILAVNGYHSIFAYRRILRPTGRYVFVGEGSNAHLLRAVFQAMLLGPVLSRTGSQKMGSMWIANINQKDLEYVKELLEAGKVVPVIDKSYPLYETAEALRYLEEVHAQGKVVITA